MVFFFMRIFKHMLLSRLLLSYGPASLFVQHFLPRSLLLNVIGTWLWRRPFLHSLTNHVTFEKEHKNRVCFQSESCWNSIRSKSSEIIATKFEGCMAGRHRVADSSKFYRLRDLIHLSFGWLTQVEFSRFDLSNWNVLRHDVWCFGLSCNNSEFQSPFWK